MDISAEIAAIQAASQGSELRQPLIGALNKLNTGSLPAVTTSDAGKILKVGANGWEVGEKSGYMPIPSETKQILENGTYDVTDYASAVVNVARSSSILIQKTITQNGTYSAQNDNADGYSSVTVNVSGGTQGVYVGTVPPESSLGSNGDYYYQRSISEGNGIQDVYISGGSGQSTLGYEFTTQKNISIKGFRIYLYNNNGIGTSAYCEFGNSLEILYTSSPITLGSGWNNIMLDNPISIEKNTNYIIKVKGSGSYFAYGTIGRQTFNHIINFVGGRYGNNWPGTLDMSNVYFADVIIESNYYNVTSEYLKESGVWVQI